jgi:hypothetical protein
LNGYLQHARNIFPHLCNVRRNLWSFEYNHGVNVCHGISVSGKKAGNIFEKHQARDPFVPWIGVWKVFTNIPESCGPDQCICYCMQKDISIRMSIQTFFVGNFYAAQNEFSALNKTVDIVTDAGSYWSWNDVT